MTSKVCSICKTNKEIGEYNKTTKKTKNDDTIWYKGPCKSCLLIKQQEYRKKNKEKVTKKANEYYLENKEYIQKRNSNYVENNRDRRNSYVREYKEKRRKEDPSYKIYENCRKRVWKVLKNKTNKTNELLGCTKMFYQMWITFTLDDKMTWGNYGKLWDIDHVKPVDTFDLLKNNEQLECFNWKNTTALNSSENYSKKNKIINSQLESHKLNIKLFNKIISFKKELKWVIRSQASLKEVEGSETR